MHRVSFSNNWNDWNNPWRDQNSQKCTESLLFDEGDDEGDMYLTKCLYREEMGKEVTGDC